MRGSRYPEELKRQALELYRESIPEYKAKKTTAKRVAELLGIRSFDTILAWVKQSDIDCGERPGVTTEAAEELRRLRREVAELKRANAILKAASVFFAAELDRPLNK
jgi:transposase